MQSQKAHYVSVGEVVLFALLALIPMPSRATRANYDRVKKGMSRVEVHAILGAPGDYRNQPTRFWRGVSEKILYSWISEAGKPEPVFECWQSDDGLFEVVFDPPEVVVATGYTDAGENDKGPIGNYLWRASRPWHPWLRDERDLLLWLSDFK